MSKKLYTPLELKNLSNTPSINPDTDYLYLYLKNSELKVKMPGGSEINAGSISGKVDWTDKDLDWDNEKVRIKTLTSNETWTFSNLKSGKTISVYITGDYAITLPSIVITDGTYDGTINNLIIFHCIDDASGSEIVVCQIFNL